MLKLNFLTKKDKDGNTINQGLNWVKKINPTVIDVMTNCRNLVNAFNFKIDYNNKEKMQLIEQRDNLKKQLKPYLKIDFSKLFNIEYQEEIKKALSINSLDGVNIIELTKQHNQLIIDSQADIINKIQNIKLRIISIEKLQDNSRSIVPKLTKINFYLFIENYRILNKMTYGELATITPLKLVVAFQEFIEFTSNNEINFKE